MNRRDFLTTSSLATAALTLPPDLMAAKSGLYPVRLGGPVFKQTADPNELALAHVALGYRAAYCPAVSMQEPAQVREFSAAFAKHGVVIAEVGRWVNLMDQDPAKRAENLKQVTDGLVLAEEIGAVCCVDIAGSRNPTIWYGPHADNLGKGFFDEAVHNARQIIDAVKPKRAKFAYEVMGWAIPDSADSYLRLIKAVDRKAFGVHLDPANMVNSPARFYRNSDLLDECFDKLGRWIVSCHAKDLTWEVEMNVHFREVRPGAGSMDFGKYLRRLAALPHQPPLMLEHLPNAEEYDLARKHLKALGATLELDV